MTVTIGRLGKEKVRTEDSAKWRWMSGNGGRRSFALRNLLPCTFVHKFIYFANIPPVDCTKLRKIPWYDH